MNHYPRHVGDYIRDTVGLTMLEEGAYTRLLDQYYARESALPSNKEMLYRLARAASKQERLAVDMVLELFFTSEADGYHQKRADKELQAQRERSESARHSAQFRWSERNANAMRTHSEGNASHKPVANSHKPRDREERIPTPEAPAVAGSPNPSPRKKLSELPADWQLPTLWRAWASEARPDWPAGHVGEVADRFLDHWRGKGERRADWEATWRNWVRNERSGGVRKVETLAEKRAANIAALCGRSGNGRNSGGVDGKVILEADGELREQDGVDVGRLSAG